MARLIKTDRVAVRDEATGDVVWIRRKMDLEAASRVQGAPRERMLLEMYVANILAWDGPELGKELCTPENIALIDPDDPFWEKVGDKIAELNPRKDDRRPLASTTPAETSMPASDVASADNSTSTPASP